MTIKNALQKRKSRDSYDFVNVGYATSIFEFTPILTTSIFVSMNQNTGKTFAILIIKYELL